jgi:MFS family permease
VIATVLPLAALLAGVALLLTGSGLLGTLLAVRGSMAGFGDQTLGLIMSCYFAGFLVGTFIAPPAIERMGHIRAFAFFAALAAASALVHPIFIDPWVWSGLRVATGIALVGMYTVIESWLNSAVDGSQRGRVFAIYMVVTLLALALGQQLLRVAPVESFVLFSLVAVLVCLAMMPVTATRLGQPPVQSYRRLGPRKLLAIAPAAVIGALGSGLIMGAFWGLGPVYAARQGMDDGQVATFMSIAILGGALLQWPIGRMSDRGDRRRTLAVVCVAAALVAAAAAMPATGGTRSQFLIFFVFGGLAFALYPVVVAHLLDHVEPDAVLPACSTVLLVHGTGSVLGPALAGFAMAHFGTPALPGYFAVVSAVLGLYVGYRLVVRRREKTQPDTHFHPMLRTTPSAMELLPESEDESK